MLVQMIFEELWQGEEKYIGAALCTWCGAEVGPITRDEMNFFLSKASDDILCFACENIRPRSVKFQSRGQQQILIDLFHAPDIHNVPLAGCDLWTSPGLDAFLQLVPLKGWCFWMQDPDGTLRLRNVGVKYNRAAEARDTFGMLPSVKS